MDRSKVMDKIQKCLALGKSPNEHEAAAAMRQAQKLMALYDISERELGAIGYACEKVLTTIQAGKKVPIVLSQLMTLVMHAFGVKGVVGREVRVSDQNFTATYFGPAHRVVLAAYSHVAIQRAVDAAWKTYLVENPSMKGVVGGRAGFVAGWIGTVRETLEAFVLGEDEERGTKLAMDNEYGRSLSTGVHNNMKVSGNAMAAGAAAGGSFQLHRPVTSERLKLAA